MIEAGRLADLVMLTTDSYHFVPLNDVINQLVYCENGISVTDVMIDGRWVLRQGKLLTIDEARLYARGRALRAEMEGRLKEQFRRTAEIEPALRQQYLKAAGTAWSDRDGAS
jgi:5-methylthioadenosine/S-adenosylhomocysteine deaminase